MVESDQPIDVEQSLADLPAPVLAEYLTQLQANLDRATERSALLRERIAKLETDRETLRGRLTAARGAAPKRVFGRRRPAAPKSESAPPPSPELESATVPAPAQEGRIDLTVATILDPISTATFDPEFRAMPLRRTAWRAQFEEHHPGLLFVESAFNGLAGDWAFRIAHFGEPHDDLVELVTAARSAGIPTVFWNKEDPINYGMFLGAASLFDYVFTVDGNAIDRYRTNLGHDRIDVLPFAAQPALHFPPASEAERTDSVAFAGSYYAKKHSERRTQMEMILGPALEFGLDIYDRMGASDDPRFAWPERFQPSVVGSVPYLEMGPIYRSYQAFLNVNTVVDSPTMCARRIFELAACGTPVVSGPSGAIERMVPPGIVHTSEDSAETSLLLGRLLSDPQLRSETTSVGPEWIANGNTYAARVAQILERVS